LATGSILAGGDPDKFSGSKEPLGIIKVQLVSNGEVQTTNRYLSRLLDPEHQESKANRRIPTRDARHSTV